ncbi:hypothetical protein PYCC9005_002048 [Savitreella phatthalungensis]
MFTLLLLSVLPLVLGKGPKSYQSSDPLTLLDTEVIACKVPSDDGQTYNVAHLLKSDFKGDLSKLKKGKATNDCPASDASSGTPQTTGTTSSTASTFSCSLTGFTFTFTSNPVAITNIAFTDPDNTNLVGTGCIAATNL